MKKNIIIFTILSIVFHLSVLPAIGEFKRPKLSTYTVEGIAPIIKLNQEKSRLDAMEGAFKNAIRLAVKDIAGSEIFKREKNPIKELVNKKSKKYIHGYRIIDDTVEDDYSNITMTVTLFIDEIKNALLKIDNEIEAKTDPLILVLIDEKASPIYNQFNFLTFFAASEDEIVKGLITDGWDVIGRNEISRIIDIGESIDGDDVKTAFTGDIEEIVYIGEEIDADFVIIGSSRIIPPAISDQMGETLIELTVRAVSMEKEEIIAEKRAVGLSTAKSNFMALAQALRQAGKKLVIYFSKLLKKE